MRNIKIIIWGFGAMGAGIARSLLNKKGIEIVGVCDLDPKKIGKSISEVLGLKKREDKVIITSNISDIIYENSCDLCICATDSFTKKAFPKFKFILENKINVISTAEEMVYPQAKNPDLAKELDEIAKKNGVSILGTGINPGLMMDILVLTLTGAMTDIESIEVSRINSLSPFGTTVMEEQGVGLSKEEFLKLVKEGKLAGHVGFEESISLMCHGLGWKLDLPIKTSMEPIISSVPRETKYIKIKSEEVAGCHMSASGVVQGVKRIQMNHPQQIEPQDENIVTGDYIKLIGSPNIHMKITPEVQGGLGTIAMCINMIPQLLNSSSGLKLMIDLPIPRAILGDFRDQLNFRLD